MSRWKKTLAVAAVCGLALTGCGEKENDDKKAAPEPTMSAEQKAACDALIAAPADFFMAQIQAEGDPAKFTPEQWTGFATQYAAIEAGTTGEASTQAGTVADTIDEAVSTKNFKLLESDAFLGSFIGVGSAGTEQCDYEAVPGEIKEMPAATPKDKPEFHWVGLPKAMDAGKYGLTVKNPSKTFHEIIAFKLADSYEGTLEDWKKLDDAAMGKISEGAAVTFIPPNATSVLNVDLTPGRYIFFCHIPLMDAKTQAPVMGPRGPIWHYVLGMAQEVTVS